MRLGRLRAGEWLALAGVVGLLVTLPLTWFEASFPALSRSGWGSLGWFLDALLVLRWAWRSGSSSSPPCGRPPRPRRPSPRAS